MKANAGEVYTVYNQYLKHRLSGGLYCAAGHSEQRVLGCDPLSGLGG